jgi:hypothetical protein
MKVTLEPVVCTKFDIYVFVLNSIYVLSWELESSREEGAISLSDLTTTVLMLTQARTWIYNIMCCDFYHQTINLSILSVPDEGYSRTGRVH